MNVPVTVFPDLVAEAPIPARGILSQTVSNEADLTVDGGAHHAVPGTWVRMPANTKHSVVAHTALVMALYLLPRDVAATS